MSPGLLRRALNAYGPNFSTGDCRILYNVNEPDYCARYMCIKWNKTVIRGMPVQLSFV